MKILNRFRRTPETKSTMYSIPQSYFYSNGSALWSARNYQKFADEAYVKNVIAHRAINMLATAAASVQLQVKVASKVAEKHPLVKLLKKPNPKSNGKEFFEALYSYKIIAGNAYILAVGSLPSELYLLRPDRMTINAGNNFIPKSYEYKIGNAKHEYKVDLVTGRSQILHLKNFHPMSDWYGLSSIEAAAYSIDQHNQAGEWNQALLQNGARPSGAIIVKGENGEHRSLSQDQFANLKVEIENVFSGPKNAGRPMLLEGGLEWQEMSLTPKDMDFIAAKHSSARDIALALGVPPQLLGIPGDNTYGNLQEARLAFWEQTVLPMVDNVVQNLSNWLCPMYAGDLSITYDADSISALAERRQVLWDKLNNCNFLTEQEKRNMLGV
ncbi:MAG: phage portal protein [Bacteroidia bacterium]